MSGPHRTSVSLAIALLTAFLSLVNARPARAHGGPTPLVFWGNFGLPIAQCQRQIGRAAALCGIQAWAARRACLIAQLNGSTCDEEATAQAVTAARIRAIESIETACTEVQVRILRFLALTEAQTDIIRACRELDNAVVSAVFGSAETSMQSVSPISMDCIDAAAFATTKLIRFALREQERALNRIAASRLSLEQKEMLLERSAERIARANAQLRRQVEVSCAGDDFTSVYGRGMETFLTNIAGRADCVAEDTYAQGAVLCPAPQCGNGMRERGEECDDGNVSDDDGCSSECVRESASFLP